MSGGSSNYKDIFDLMRSLFTTVALAGAGVAASQVPTLLTTSEQVGAAQLRRCASEVDFSDEHFMSRLSECQLRAHILQSSCPVEVPA